MATGDARFQILDSAGPVGVTERRMRRILKQLLGEPGEPGEPGETDA